MRRDTNTIVDLVAAKDARIAELEAENEKLRETLKVYADPCDSDRDPSRCGYEGNMCCQAAHTALEASKEN